VLDTACGVSDWTLHDLRRTFATNMAALGVRIEVTEKLLNHISGSFGGIVGVYQRHAYMDEMRTAVAAWEARLAHLLAADAPDEA
jgi:integrase